MLRRQQAIISSMTREERRRPELIKASRKQRIAGGLGRHRAGDQPAAEAAYGNGPHGEADGQAGPEGADASRHRRPDAPHRGKRHARPYLARHQQSDPRPQVLRRGPEAARRTGWSGRSPGYGFGYGAATGEPKFWIGLPLAKRRKPKACAGSHVAFAGPEPQGGRCLLQGGDQGRRQGQRQARPAPRISRRTTTAPSSSTPRVTRSRPCCHKPE